MHNYKNKSAKNTGSCIDLLSENYGNFVTKDIPYGASKGTRHRAKRDTNYGIKVVPNAYFDTGYSEYSQTNGVKKEKGFFKIINFISKNNGKNGYSANKINIDGIFHPGDRC